VKRRASFVLSLLVAVLAVPAVTPVQAAPPERLLPLPDVTLHPRGGHARSGVRCAADEVNRPFRGAHAQPRAAAGLSGTSALVGDRVVPVAIHVIYSTKRGQQLGNVSQAQIDDQIQILNDAYAGKGFSFYLASVDRTQNNKWFTNCYNIGTEYEMKQALAVDPATTLNIYTCQPSQNILGYAYLPSSFPEDDYRHGVVLPYETLPGGGFGHYSLGDTATHEVGHYLGLEHTFENGCSAPGDYVDDTPYESSPDYYCTGGRDTCPSAGLDPNQNYMDYGDDVCMIEFTAGQATRMADQTSTYHPTLGTPPPGCGDSSCDAGEDSCSCPVDCGAPPATESNCSDGVDNDCNGHVDCSDSNCSGTPSCTSSCSGSGASCTSNAQCCSGNCRTRGKKANTCN